MRLIIASLLLTFSAVVQSFADGNATNTISTQLLALESANISAMRAEFQTQDIIPYSFKIKGEEHTGNLLTPTGYAKVFKETGGPYLRWLGLDFRHFTDPRKPYFYLYTGLLVFMIGLQWFSMVNATASGKGKFEVIPLLLKLMMGLVVAYNLPFVYGMAMSLKNLGTQIVAMAISNESSAERLSAAGANAPIIINARQEAVREGAKRALASMSVTISEVEPKSVTIPGKTKTTKVHTGPGEWTDKEVPDGPATINILDTATADRNSGRARVAALTVALNKRIGLLYGGRFVTLADSKGAKIGPSSINFVGFPKPPPNYVVVSIPGQGAVPMPTNDKSGRVITNPYTPNGAGKLDINEALRTDVILQKFAPDEASANFLYDKIVERLADYINFASMAYSDIGQPRESADLSKPSAMNAIRLLESGGAIGGVAKETALGDALYALDRDLVINQLNDADMKNYRQAISDATFNWLTSEAPVLDAATTKDTTPDNAKSWFSWVPDGIASLPSKIMQYIIDLVVGIIKWFWIPALARIAAFIFNFTIEFYVYLLWLAYPLWFYKKTEKAFTGALDTMVTTCFTVMTFCLLVYVFESFAGWLRSSLTTSMVLGVAGFLSGAAGGAAAIASGAVSTGGAVAAPILVGAALGSLAAIGVGHAVFYVVGTFLCFRLAPKVFQAWKEGTSVVAPMVSAAATAMMSGLAGGVLAGFGAGAAGAGMLTAAGKSGALGAVGKKIGRFAENTGLNKVAGGIKSIASSAVSPLKKVAALSERAPALSRVARQQGSISKGIAADILSVGSSIGTRTKQFMQDPMSGLGRMAQSTAAKIGVVTASGFGGDPNKPIENLGKLMFATELLRRQGGQQSTTVPGSSEDRNTTTSTTNNPPPPPPPPTPPAGGNTTSPSPSTININAGSVNINAGGTTGTTGPGPANPTAPTGTQQVSSQVESRPPGTTTPGPRTPGGRRPTDTNQA